jgi:primosomal protein N' (replication factor Y)
MRCHYCNHSARVPQSCADCSGEVIRFSGFGTQRLEEETRRLFSSARIMRLDRDTTRKRSAFESMYQKMKAGEIDILIGTQMITKGHDFPNVTLVGVVNADLSLNIPDFRSCERSFQLLTQVSGRAGRGKVPGKVIIQTFNPKHYVFDLVRHHDYENFYKKEIKLRERLNFPPLTRLTTLEVESGIEGEGEKLARRAKNAIAEKIKKQKGVELLGPARAALYRINNKFRWHMILRGPDVRPLQDIINDCPVFQELRKTASGKARLFIDVDPVNML